MAALKTGPPQQPEADTEKIAEEIPEGIPEAAPGSAQEPPRVWNGRLLLWGGAAVWVVSTALTVAHVADFAERYWWMGDLRTYFQSVSTLRHGQTELYAPARDGSTGPFIYPPFAALLFRALIPLGLTGFKLVFLVAGYLSLCAAVWTAWRMTGLRRGRLAGATLLVVGIAMWSEPVHKTFVFGQVSLVLMAVVLLDLALPDTSRWKGVAIGLATGFKLTPGLFIVYLLLTRRFRAAATASGVLAATVAAGFVLLPRAASTYWFHAIGVGPDITSRISMADGINQSLRACLLRLLGQTTAATAAWAVCAVLVAVVGMAAAVRAHRDGRELLGGLLCAGVALLVSPISWSHHWVWAVPAAVLLVRLGWTHGRGWWLVAAAYLPFVLAWPLRIDQFGSWAPATPVMPYAFIWLTPHQDGRDFHWNAWQFVVGNSLLFSGLLLTAAAAVLVFRRPTASALRSPDPARERTTCC